LENLAKFAEKIEVYLKGDKISDTLCVDLGVFVVVVVVAADNIILPLNSSNEMVSRCRIATQASINIMNRFNIITV